MMKSGRMLEVCSRLLDQLDSLESVLSHVPESDKPFIYDAMRDLRELQVIAKYEIADRATKQQVQHITEIQVRVERISALIPKEAYQDHDDDDT